MDYNIKSAAHWRTHKEDRIWGGISWSRYYIWVVTKEREIQSLKDVEWEQHKSLKNQAGSSYLSNSAYTETPR